MFSRVVALCLCALTFVGCSALPRQQAVPMEKSSQAKVVGLEDVRYVVDDPNDMERMAQDLLLLWDRQRKLLASQGKNMDDLPQATFLAISGGGDKGAYAAGLLNGWTKTGQRPSFTLVTGISTGALIAPFAFLGSSHDKELAALYTNTSSEDLVEVRGVLAALTEDAVLDTAPLRRMVSQVVNQPFLDAIAAEYAKGRILLISTTNIDSSRRVIWDMTKIAASKHPGALKLFHDIMMASAAIPAAFPPVLIDVAVDGKPYQEMHVDGGTTSQVFIYPASINLAKLSEENGIHRQRKLYIIMNERIDPEWGETERRVFNIAQRSLGTLIHNQGIGDLFEIFVTAYLDKVDFNLAYIPASFNHPNPGVFDTDYMRSLYQVGFDRAVKGYEWQKTPPGLTERMKAQYR
ncbi:MAG: patatin-like phospholipase family protein [Pseudomonadota bacterium]